MLCCERDIDPISTLLDQQMKLLTKIFASGVGYSSLAEQDQPCHLFSLWAMGYPFENISLFKDL